MIPHDECCRPDESERLDNADGLFELLKKFGDDELIASFEEAAGRAADGDYAKAGKLLSGVVETALSRYDDWRAEP